MLHMGVALGAGKPYPYPKSACSGGRVDGSLYLSAMPIALTCARRSSLSAGRGSFTPGAAREGTAQWLIVRSRGSCSPMGSSAPRLSKRRTGSPATMRRSTASGCVDAEIEL